MRRVLLTVTESNCRSGVMRAGESFVVSDTCPPICHELFYCAYPFLYALLNGGELESGGERTKRFAVRCPDGGRVLLSGELMEP